MSFFAIFLALLLEQARPLGEANVVHRGISAWVAWVRRMLDAGQPFHGWLALCLAVGVPAVSSTLIYLALDHFNTVLGFAWLVLMLYVTLGFRQFSHHFTAIREALEAGDEDLARTLLARWEGVELGEGSRGEILRHVIEHSVLSAHRHVFGVLFCFVVLGLLGLGPAGAVLYRLAEFLPRAWHSRVDEGVASSLQPMVDTAWKVIDYLPARLTALSFAVVGNFEEAVATWRQDASGPMASNESVVLAATAGAVNVRLGRRMPEASENGSFTDGREPQLAHLASVVGLVWRSVVLWLLLLALLTLARLLG